MSKGGVFKYVRHYDRAEYERLGWKLVTEDLGHHSMYSSLYKWHGKGRPTLPEERDLFHDQEIENNLKEFDAIFGTGGDGE